MFLRVLFFLVVTWLVAGILRLFLGARRERRVSGGAVRRGFPPAPPPYSRSDLVDARFAEIADDRADAGGDPRAGARDDPRTDTGATDGVDIRESRAAGTGHAERANELPDDRSREEGGSETGRAQDAASASSRRRFQG